MRPCILIFRMDKVIKNKIICEIRTINVIVTKEVEDLKELRERYDCI